LQNQCFHVSFLPGDWAVGVDGRKIGDFTGGYGDAFCFGEPTIMKTG
jgi:hypothetical protein